MYYNLVESKSHSNIYVNLKPKGFSSSTILGVFLKLHNSYYKQSIGNGKGCKCCQKWALSGFAFQSF